MRRGTRDRVSVSGVVGGSCPIVDMFVGRLSTMVHVPGEGAVVVSDQLVVASGAARVPLRRRR